MYIVIESYFNGSEQREDVIGHFETKEEAWNEVNRITPIGKQYCDYYLTKLVN